MEEDTEKATKPTKKDEFQRKKGKGLHNYTVCIYVNYVCIYV